MEFLSLHGKMNVRIGWFSRPKDIIVHGKKKHFDHRLLFATMNSDINP